MSLSKTVRKAVKGIDNGDPMKDFIDDYEIMEALEWLVWYMDEYGDPVE